MSSVHISLGGTASSIAGCASPAGIAECLSTLDTPTPNFYTAPHANRTCFADNSILIAGRFFHRFNNEQELNDHLDEVAPHWERIELPESFPCLAEFHLDENERPCPVFFTAKDVQLMNAILDGNFVPLANEAGSF